MHSVTSNAVAEALSYSTTEEETGAMYNGKKVYKCSFFINSFASGSGSHPYNTGITGIDTVLKFNSIIKRSNGDIFEMPYYNVFSSNYTVINYMDSNGFFYVITSGDKTGAKITLNLEYTKTS